MDEIGPRPQRPLVAPAAPGDVALEQRPVIHCTMGQGAMANLGRYSLFSDQFSSCSPVVMVNTKTLAAGLFHYAARGVGQQRELERMYRRVAPTHVGVNRRPDVVELASRNVLDYSKDDYESLRGFFAELTPAAKLFEIPKHRGSFGLYLDEQDTIRIEGDVPRGAATYDATNFTSGVRLNPEVDLLVSREHWGPGFASKRYTSAMANQ